MAMVACFLFKFPSSVVSIFGIMIIPAIAALRCAPLQIPDGQSSVRGRGGRNGQLTAFPAHLAVSVLLFSTAIPHFSQFSFFFEGVDGMSSLNAYVRSHFRIYLHEIPCDKDLEHLSPL
jgi:hypothetical protein